MAFELIDFNKKYPKITKSVYLPEELAKKIEEMAAKHGTTFSGVIVSMIEYCLDGK